MGVVRSALASRAVGSVTSPHHVDHYLEKLHPLWTAEAVRAKVVGIERETDNATTVTLRPNGAWTRMRITTRLASCAPNRRLAAMPSAPRRSGRPRGPRCWPTTCMRG